MWYRLLHIVAHRRWNHYRQITVHARCVGTLQLGLQVQPTRQAAGGRGAGLPPAAGAARHVGVGKAQLRHAHRPLTLVGLPAHVGLQLVERDAGGLQHAGHVDAATGGQRQLSLAAVRAGVKLQLQAVDAGAAWGAGRIGRGGCACGGAGGGRGGQRQITDVALHVPVHHHGRGESRGIGGGACSCSVRCGVAAPLRVQAAHPALGLQAGQGWRHAGGQGQVVGQLVQQGQVELFGVQRVCGGWGHVLARRRCGAGLAVTHVATGPIQSAGGAQGQPFGGPALLRAVVLPAQAAAQVLQWQRWPRRGQRQQRVAQCHIGGQAGDAAVCHLQPGAQGTLAAGRGLIRWQVFLQVRRERRQVQPIRFGVQRARPVLPWGRIQLPQRLAQLAAQAQALAPVGGGLYVQPKIVRPPGVALHQRQVVPDFGSGGGCGHFVVPVQLPATQHPLGLRKKPVQPAGRCAVGRWHYRHPRHQPLSLCGALHMQRGTVQHQLLQPQPPQGPCRQRHLHTLHLQCGLARRVAHLQAVQRHAGHPARSRGCDGADAHRLPQRPRGQRFQLRPPVANSRHNEAVQHHRAQAQQQHPGRHQPQQRAHATGQQPQRAWGVGGCGTHDSAKLTRPTPIP